MKRLFDLSGIFAIIIFLNLWLPSHVHAKIFVSVSGKVIDAETKEGIKDIKIALVSQLDGEIASTALSNEKGVFILKDVTQGIYNLLGFSDNNSFINSEEATPITVPLGKNVINVIIKLQKGGAIKGRVLTEKGLAVPHANIMGDGGISTSTDENGNFILKGTDVGDYKVAILAGSAAIKKLRLTTEKGKTTDIGDITLNFDVNTALRGKVTDNKGLPVPGAFIVAYNSNGSAGYSVSSKEGSVFLAGLDPGKYEVFIVGFGYEQVKLSDISVPTNKLNVTLTSAPEQTAGLIKYQLAEAEKEGGFFIKALELITPNDAIAKACKNEVCPDGFWGALHFDASAIYRPLKGTLNLITYHCFSSSAKIDLTSVCGAVGPSTDFREISFGGGFGWCTDVCCSDEIIESKKSAYTSVVGEVRILVIKGAGGGVLHDDGADCRVVMPFNSQLAWPDWKKLKKSILKYVGGGIQVQRCKTEAITIWDFLNKIGII
ncbi:carboxypeptidase regulatory-like domain-containing protein [Candidatus Pacearchaeota archaeon]|nr:carboxypeptidase regulatory-like domain-containing protein [Candidatus Pacearchaeota archaeon]